MKSNQLTVNYNKQPAYQIYLEPDFMKLPSILEELQVTNRKVMIVSDSTVSMYYLSQVKDIIASYCLSVYDFVFPAGEKSKNLDTVEECYEHLIQYHFDRNDLLIALGGGVVGDLTGYVAATYLRGVRFIQMPTSLLAMVDSSIGGKTGVDFKQYKNMVGAFHQPKAVYMNLSTLNSLSDKEFCSGISEIIKHGLIKDNDYFEWLRENSEAILNKEYNALCEMIYRSCDIKRGVVERDPYEQGERALLNFGHTIGHAVEKLMNLTLLHGECVSIGSIAAAYLSYQLGYIEEADFVKIKDTFVLFHQPVKIENLLTDDIIAATKHDKKMDGKTIKFIRLDSIGEAVIDSSIDDQMLALAISAIH